ncbi:MAG TPA: SRPBCC family protein [Kofleriaceae bacterium]|nr:SRPBCC family protein [Kofleriaceae bacterium]
MSETDRIEKQVHLRAPLARVWRAVSDAREFGTWFGVDFDGPFVAGERLTGRITPTKVDPEIAAMQAPHAGAAFEIAVVTVVPMTTFAFRWHPYAIDPEVDYSAEASTLVTFELREADDGTVLTIVESGFDSLPIERRAEAFSANEGGWTMQAQLIAKYLDLGDATS